MRQNLVMVTLVSWLVAGCGGGTDGGGSTGGDRVRDAVALKRIGGTVGNARTGAPIAGAIVETNPVTESVATDGDGAYAIDDAVNDAGRYQVTASKLGFRSGQRTVSVAANDVTTADFLLEPIVDGLAASVLSLHFGVGRSARSFLLTSTAADTGFTSAVGEPWLRVIPGSGIIAENELELIRVEVDRRELVGTRVATQLVVNTDNGLSGVVLDVTVDLEASSPANDGSGEDDLAESGSGDVELVDPGATEPLSEGSADTDGASSSDRMPRVLQGPPTLADDQSDCRLLDILQVGFGEAAAPIAIFPDTRVLPGGEGAYHRGLVPSVHVESFQLRQEGTLSVAHVAGGRPDTDAVLFDLDRDGMLREYAVNDRDRAGPAALSALLAPGLYCYLVQPDGGYFGWLDGTIDLRVEFVVEEG